MISAPPQVFSNKNRKKAQNSYIEIDQQSQEMDMDDEYSEQLRKTQELMKIYYNKYEHAEINDEVLIPMTKNYDEFLQKMSANIKQSQTQMSMMFGQNGKGKKSCVRYAIYQLRNQFNICLLDVDACLFKDDQTLFRQIIKKIKRYDINLFKDLDAKNLNEQISFTKLIEKINSTNATFIIQIDNFQELVKNKKQALLYKILDLLKDYKSTLQLVAITGHAFVQDLFEKRIYSRFSASIYSFYEVNPDAYIKMLQTRSQLKPNSYYPQIESINEKLFNVFNHKKITDFYKTLLENEPYFQDMNVILSVTQLALYRVSAEYFNDFDHNDIANILIQELELCVKLRKFDQVNFMLTQLTKPQIQVLLFVRKLQKEGLKRTINFEEVLELDMKYQLSIQSTISFGSSQTFSREVLVSAFSHLIDYQILQLSQDSTHKNFSNSSITIIVHEDDILAFEKKVKDQLGDALLSFLTKP